MDISWLALAGSVVVPSIFALTTRLFSSRKFAHDGARRTVLITGAASGLGLVTARQCARAGDIVVALDVDAEALDRLRREMKDSEFITVLVDVTDEASVAEAAQRVRATVRQVDTVCHFAGVIRGGPLVEMATKDMQLTMGVNVIGLFNVTKEFFPLLRREPQSSDMYPPSPKIIAVASEVSLAWLSACFNAPYSMSKFAVEAFATALRQELSLLPHPVAVVTLNPGAMKTAMLADQKPGGSNAFFEIASRRRGTLFAPHLLKGGEMAVQYMNKHESDPAEVGRIVLGVVHDPAPARRYVIGASLPMRFLMPYLPQPLLDFAMKKLLS
eukprot:TRINITY_DN38142_c0_g1_i1.p1 TRINITY_DN38142_c0_g1~~TRINITY_DN38142_c0_g1_i1.p1  ORF type:complete len:345 (+),score=37.57 TRINITY_DN38142_c0_g1_i1:54-1037(+)